MLDFYISLETEKNKLMDMFCVGDSAVSHEYRAKQYHFPLELATEMYQEPRFKWDEKLEDFLAKSYLDSKNKLNDSMKFFTEFWEENEEKYFSKINLFFQDTIPTYRILLAHYLDAISNWVEPNIVVNAYSYQTSNPLYHVYSLLYEIILSQVFIRTRNIKSKSEFSDDKLWTCSELIAFAFLTTTFPEFSKCTGTGYPQLDIYAKDFLELIKQNKTFDKVQNEILKPNFLKKP